jgi:predicted regulator of Ras-like GTPase activity (Roadblock/LC7/MglB family)
MLKSLFGDLYPLRAADARRQEPAEFVATAVLESYSGEVNPQGQIVDRHEKDLFVSGSAAQAMRNHFATVTQNTSDLPQRIITLLDPSRMWAGAVVKALSDASGQPIERLHLRDQASLKTLAVIERTRLGRRMEESLKVYHADVRAPEGDATAIPLALMERSDLSVVIVGPSSPSGLDQLLRQLLSAAQSRTWRCQNLLFMLPVGALWIASKIEATDWPKNMRVDSLCEPLTSASTVWNKLLAHWTRVKTHRMAEQSWGHPAPESEGFFRLPAAVRERALKGAVVAPPVDTGFGPFQTLAGSTGLTQYGSLPQEAGDASSGRPSGLHAELADFAPTQNDHAAHHAAPDAAQADPVLRQLSQLDGVIFAALVRLDDGLVVASEGRGPDVDRAAAAAAQVMRAHTGALGLMGHSRKTETVDEILVTAGTKYHILRTLQSHHDYFILAVLDKLRSNLAMTRFRVMEAQQLLD